ncbi:F-box only protein 5 [Protopterus annectens]|uniref:F-box only protein 5 n=1 Tax=Protopterus annectens TaxID=7888 RepID=UPI001CFC1BC1|nr:F-box only protein 5 [Protopterus annectens]
MPGIQGLQAVSVHEDSGYSSLLCTPGDSDSSLDLGHNCNSPTSPLWNGMGTEPRDGLLPARDFERAVCSTLRKNSRKMFTNSLKWLVSGSCFGLENLIGKKMGLEAVDIVSELWKRKMKHILGKILRYLGEADVVRFAKVSKTWQKIILDNKWTNEIYSTNINNEECRANHSEDSLTRDFSSTRATLHTVQKATCRHLAPKEKELVQLSHSQQMKHTKETPSRYDEFRQVASTLRKDQSLRTCVRCGSPAKLDSFLQRAKCNRAGCGFDFCTKCLCGYHESRLCTAYSPKQILKVDCLPGSKKSKKNLKRL